MIGDPATNRISQDEISFKSNVFNILWSVLPYTLKSELFSIILVAIEDNRLEDTIRVAEDVLCEFIAQTDQASVLLGADGLDSLESITKDVWIDLEWEALQDEIMTRIIGIEAVQIPGDGYIGRGRSGPVKSPLLLTGEPIREIPRDIPRRDVSLPPRRRVHSEGPWQRCMNSDISGSGSLEINIESNKTKREHPWIRNLSYSHVTPTSHTSTLDRRKEFQQLSHQSGEKTPETPGTFVIPDSMRGKVKRTLSKLGKREVLVSNGVCPCPDKYRIGYERYRINMMKDKIIHDKKEIDDMVAPVDPIPKRGPQVSEGAWRLLEWGNIVLFGKLIKHDPIMHHNDHGTPALCLLKSFFHSPDMADKILRAFEEWSTQPELIRDENHVAGAMFVLLVSHMETSAMSCKLEILLPTICNACNPTVIKAASMNFLDVLSMALQLLGQHNTSNYYNMTANLLRAYMKVFYDSPGELGLPVIIEGCTKTCCKVVNLTKDTRS